MDPKAIDRIRSTTFTVGRRGYDKREVDRWLSRLADWLEAGGGDDARASAVRNELERVADKTRQILVEAHDAAEIMRSESSAEIERLRNEAEEAARALREQAEGYAGRLRSEADAYSERARIEADSYAQETRAEADAYAEQKRREAQGEVERAADEGQAQAERIIDDARARHAELEVAIADLEERRAAVVGALQRLASDAAAPPEFAQDDHAALAEAGFDPGSGGVEPGEIGELEPAWDEEPYEEAAPEYAGDDAVEYSEVEPEPPPGEGGGPDDEQTAVHRT